MSDMPTWDWPADWSSTPPVEQSAFKVSEEIHAIIVLFDGGSNGLVLAYPGGVRFARMAPQTGWALEERFDGNPPAFMQAQQVSDAWRFLLDTFIEGGKRAEADMGGRPS